MNSRLLSSIVIFGVVAFVVSVASGQGPKFTVWTTPVIVSELSTPGSDSPNSVSKDGLSLYLNHFEANYPAGTGEDIYVSHRSDKTSPWETAARLPDTINTRYNERHGFISPDGHWLFFASNRPGGLGSYDIYVSWRQHVNDDGAWETAVNLTAVNSIGFDVGPKIFVDDWGITHLYFNSNPVSGTAIADIYHSVLGADGFGTPVLVPELSSPFHEGAVYPRKDGCEIFFPRTEAGLQNIMTSSRASTDALWTTPVYILEPGLLGDPSITSITNPVLSWDAMELYVGVYQTGVDSGNANIYVAYRQKTKGKTE